MTPFFKIKAATLSDSGPVAELFDAYRVFYKKPSDLKLARRFITARLKNKDSHIIAAVSNTKEFLGFVQLYPSFSSTAASRIFVLNDLYVKPEFRRMGIAERLIEATCAYAKKSGAVRVDLGTQKTNASAQKLYVKMAFIETTDFKFYSRAIKG